jgi:hypothetical protein
VVLSSFYWGYILSQIPGSVLAQRYGGKVRSLNHARSALFDTCQSGRARVGHIPGLAVLGGDALVRRSRAALAVLSLHHWQVTRGTEQLQLTKFRSR